LAFYNNGTTVVQNILIDLFRFIGIPAADQSRIRHKDTCLEHGLGRDAYTWSNRESIT